jgi:hypothetical protein
MPINACCNFNLYYVLYFDVIYFLKLIVHETNSEMVKLTKRYKTDIIDGTMKLTGREKN